MASPVQSEIQPGRRARVTQQITQGGGTWTTEIEGEIVSYRQAKTGSWFAHSKDDHLWLDRLELRGDDGELTILSLDENSRVQILPEEAAAKSDSDGGEG